MDQVSPPLAGRARENPDRAIIMREMRVDTQSIPHIFETFRS
jgi:hypothetical protein